MRKRAGFLILLVLLALAGWRWKHLTAPPPGSVPVPAPAVTETSAPAKAVTAPAYYPPLDRLADPAGNVSTDLRVLRDLFFHYQLAVKDPSGNPRGTHEEIVRALRGRNRLGLAFLPARHPALNEHGQLVDRWGTPYFFHALSSTRMEIRSAGPDQRMYTEDDVRLSPEPRARAANSEGGKSSAGAFP